MIYKKILKLVMPLFLLIGIIHIILSLFFFLIGSEDFIDDNFPSSEIIGVRMKSDINKNRDIDDLTKENIKTFEKSLDGINRSFENSQIDVKFTRESFLDFLSDIANVYAMLNLITSVMCFLMIIFGLSTIKKKKTKSAIFCAIVYLIPAVFHTVLFILFLDMVLSFTSFFLDVVTVLYIICIYKIKQNFLKEKEYNKKTEMVNSIE
ncbi:MAG: hypothetical protein IJ583_05160 [Firmicutes bacterium]|nr:hypothetical protein [Bacillota bacterium]